MVLAHAPDAAVVNPLVALELAGGGAAATLSDALENGFSEANDGEPVVQPLEQRVANPTRYAVEVTRRIR